jgi:hypothetical protein
VGFEEIRVTERQAFGLADIARYPLFAPEFVDFLARVMPADRHAELVYSIVVTARKPEEPRADPR